MILREGKVGMYVCRKTYKWVQREKNTHTHKQR